MENENLMSNERDGKQETKVQKRARHMFLVLTLAICVLFLGWAILANFAASETREGADEFDLSPFFGLPSEKTTSMNARNLYAGLMLGLVFGFLDNLGLFVGMEKLDSFNQDWAHERVSELVQPDKREEIIETADGPKTLEEVMVDGMQSGLGNTFSDVVGVVVGSCVLQAAKSGMGVDPSFWPLDIISMAIGCLLGVVLPVIAKYHEFIKREKHLGCHMQRRRTSARNCFRQHTRCRRRRRHILSPFTCLHEHLGAARPVAARGAAAQCIEEHENGPSQQLPPEHNASQGVASSGCRRCLSARLRFSFVRTDRKKVNSLCFFHCVPDASGTACPRRTRPGGARGWRDSHGRQRPRGSRQASARAGRPSDTAARTTTAKATPKARDRAGRGGGGGGGGCASRSRHSPALRLSGTGCPPVSAVSTV